MKTDKKEIKLELLIPVPVTMYAGWDDNGEVEIHSAQVSCSIQPRVITESLDDDGWDYLEEKITEACGPKPECY